MQKTNKQQKHVLVKHLIRLDLRDMRSLVTRYQDMLPDIIGFIGVVLVGGVLVRVQLVPLGGRGSLAPEPERDIEIGWKIKNSMGFTLL